MILFFRYCDIYVCVNREPIMNKERIQQLREESDSWKRLLEFIQSENTSIKTRISDITSGNISKECLVAVEGFQQHCIRKDELTGSYKREVQHFDAWLDNLEITPTTAMFQYAVERQQQLRTDIKTLSQRFHQLKFNFHDFVAANF
jgi:hypothetical protein